MFAALVVAVGWTAHEIARRSSPPSPPPRDPPRRPRAPPRSMNPRAAAGWLGFRGSDAQGGVRVTEVFIGGPASREGLAVGDLLTTVNGAPATRSAIAH